MMFKCMFLLILFIKLWFKTVCLLQEFSSVQLIQIQIEQTIPRYPVNLHNSWSGPNII